MTDFNVIELRRYTMTEGSRDRFIHYLESYLADAHQALGSLILGSFRERGNANRFAFLRGYPTMGARAIFCSAFYYGPLWKEHRDRMNAMLVDWQNVLLLRPVRPIAVLPAVDVDGEVVGGVAVMQIFEAGDVRELESTFAAYRDAGMRELAVLATLDEPNNFPQHPFRTDGPWVVWLGIAKNEETVERVRAMADEKSEVVILDPTARSRMRWLDSATVARSD